MSETTEFIIGSEVLCGNGVCGELTRVVVDPIARTVTHLVVEPRHRRHTGRLVPIALVDSTAQEIRLQCTQSEFDALDEADVTQFLTGGSGMWDYEQEHVLSLPYYRLVPEEMSGTSDLGMGMESVHYDKVPIGEVEVHRGDPVHAMDGPIGRVQGLVLDPADHQVTHVLLDEGHLWGEKEVAIPISAVTGFEDGVQLNLTKDEVRDLPPVDIDHPE